jgi:hypothetical protein
MGKKRREKLFWAEFYSLANDCGITFRVAGMQLFGGHLRLRMPLQALNGNDEPWVDIFPADGNYVVNGVEWTDFACSPRRWKCFKRLTHAEAAVAVHLTEEQ